MVALLVERPPQVRGTAKTAETAKTAMMEPQPGMTVDTMLEQLIDKLLGETDWKDKMDDACYRVICDMYTKYPSTKCGSTLTQPNIVHEAMDLLMEEHDRASMCDYGTWEDMLNVGRVALK